MTGLSPAVGLTLLLGGALFILVGLALLVMSRHPRATRAQDARTDPITLPELLEPRTTAIPQIGALGIRPSVRPPGELFTPHDNSED